MKPVNESVWTYYPPDGSLTLVVRLPDLGSVENYLINTGVLYSTVSIQTKGRDAKEPNWFPAPSCYNIDDLPDSEIAEIRKLKPLK